MKVTIHQLHKMVMNARQPHDVGDRLVFDAPRTEPARMASEGAEPCNETLDTHCLVAVEEWNGNRYVLNWAVEL